MRYEPYITLYYAYGSLSKQGMPEELVRQLCPGSTSLFIGQGRTRWSNCLHPMCRGLKGAFVYLLLMFLSLQSA
ncbi:hypothetical protein LY76DRAFT_62104 [Colletotrichum caudatum]|nr:hypothetical protein LY76DRAFT_62104 [Colletotrichum caudatum]